MYKIIGADRKEYGPISVDQLKYWITEGRVNHETLARPEGGTQWQPLASYTDFADVFGQPEFAQDSAAPGTGAPPSSEQLVASDYELDIGTCLSRGWELVKGNFWPIVGITFLVFLAGLIIDYIIGFISKPAMDELLTTYRTSPKGIGLIMLTIVLSMPVSSVVMGGLFRYYLKLIRRQPASIGDAFSGFTDGFGQLAVLGLVQGVFLVIAFCLCVLPSIYLSICWYFAIPLVVDRGMPFWDAMELSRKMVSKHWFLVFGFMLVMGLVSASGLVACCVGIIATLPIGLIALMYGYEAIFSAGTRPTA
jgi:GYF domain 2